MGTLELLQNKRPQEKLPSSAETFLTLINDIYTLHNIECHQTQGFTTHNCKLNPLKALNMLKTHSVIQKL